MCRPHGSILFAFDLFIETQKSYNWGLTLVFITLVSAFLCLGFIIPGNWDLLKQWPIKEKLLVPENNGLVECGFKNDHM